MTSGGWVSFCQNSFGNGVRSYGGWWDLISCEID